MSKNLDDTLPLQSKKRKYWIQEVRGKRLQGTAKSRSNAYCLPSLSASSLLGKNRCLETHCSLTVMENRKDGDCLMRQKSCGKIKDGGEKSLARTEQESERRKREIDIAAETSEALVNGLSIGGKT